jgi:YHS domain-containing protein
MKTITILFFAIALFVSSVTLFAQNVEPVGSDKIANGGYDFVSYFSDNTATKGKKEFTHEIKGVKYQFASAEHKNLFKSNPEKYLPVCDGYCAWGVAEKGIKVPVNPETFKVIDNKLYLFFNGDFKGSLLNTLPEWNKNEAGLLAQLPTNWAKLKK